MEITDLITDTVKRITSSGFDPNTAPWDHKVCVMLHAAQGIIDNGGFEYFFESPFEGDPDMQDFPRVFEAVGAASSASALWNALERAKSDSPTYDDLNNLLWTESEKNYALLINYIRKHERSYA